jgi:hypothetical protein
MWAFTGYMIYFHMVFNSNSVLSSQHYVKCMTRGKCADHSCCPFHTTTCPPKSQLVQRTRTVLFFLPTTPSIFAMGLMMRPMSPGLHCLTPAWPHPPVATLPQTHGPLIPDQEVLRTSAYSLCQVPFPLFLLLATTYVGSLSFPAWLQI